MLERLQVPATVNVLTGSGMNFMIGRVSYTFGFQGQLHARTSSDTLNSAVIPSQNVLCLPELVDADDMSQPGRMLQLCVNLMLVTGCTMEVWVR